MEMASITTVIIDTAASLFLGMIVAGLYMFRNSYSKSFVVTLALLPAMVQLVILLVNGNVGAGVAVMGAFSLVRFRSIPGNARDIGSIFLAMGLGLATGMNQLLIAFVFTMIIGGMTLLLNTLGFAEKSREEKELRITLPENLDYTELFDDLLDEFTQEWELVKVKTTNMGSLYELSFRVIPKGDGFSKELMDALRCRNGNLPIQCGRPAMSREEL